MGELLSVSEAEGEHLVALGSFESFPFRLLIAFAATFPVNGDSFWLVVAPQKRLPGRGAGTALAVTEGLRQTERCELLYNPSGSLRSPPPLSGQAGGNTNQKLSP